jgi:hypothetical protein
MVGIGKGPIFKQEVLSITSKALLVGIFREVESLVLHKHPKNTIKMNILIQFFYVSLSGHNMGTTLIVMLE